MNTTILSPRQVAGRLNRAKRKGLTPAGQRRLKEAAIANRPWQHSTGPRTAAGKARTAANGKRRQKGELSVRERRALIADVTELSGSLAQLRRALLSRIS